MNSTTSWPRWRERAMEALIVISGFCSIIFVALIFLFLFKEGVRLFAHVPPLAFLTGRSWYPISTPPQFGAFPLIVGSLYVTLGALVIAVPLSLASAFYIAEVARGTTKEILKSGIELLAAIPSVVTGFIGMTVLAPSVRQLFHLPTGLTAFTGSLSLPLPAGPTITLN